MRGWTVALLFAVVSIAAVGCVVENPSIITDSTGAELHWDCDNGNCTPSRGSFSPFPPVCGDDEPELLVGAGPLAILCAVGRTPEGRDLVYDVTCRPLVCTDELDCPQWNARPYICLDGICQVQQTAGFRLDRVDLTALCLQDVPRHESCAAAEDDPVVQARLALVDEACPDECTSVPDACLPTP